MPFIAVAKDGKLGAEAKTCGTSREEAAGRAGALVEGHAATTHTDECGLGSSITAIRA